MDPLDAIEFPVLCFGGGILDVIADADRLTKCTPTALRNGFYRGLFLIDRNGRGVRVKGARKVGGAGWSFEHGIFPIRRIRVALETDGDARSVGLEDARARVLKALDGWSSRLDFEEFKKSVAKAPSIAEIIERLAAEGHDPPEGDG